MWTRNYQNLINTAAFFRNPGANVVSSNGFGDTYFGNYRTPSGTVREICTYNNSTDYGNRIARSSFIAWDGTNTSASMNVIFNQTESKGLYGGNTIYVALGSSGTPESFEDYRLESIITAGYTVQSRLATSELNADGTVTVDYSLTIMTTVDLTVQEIGIYLPVPYYANASTGSTATYAYYALINRIVLDEAVSVNANQTATITFSITTPKVLLNQS